MSTREAATMFEGGCIRTNFFRYIRLDQIASRLSWGAAMCCVRNDLIFCYGSCHVYIYIPGGGGT